MENMAEEELLPLEKEEVAQVLTPAPDSARVPAAAPDSAVTPASASALALAQAPALSPSLASAPEEAESSKCRRPRSFCRREARKSPGWGAGRAFPPGWLLWGRQAWENERAVLRVRVKLMYRWMKAPP